MKTLIACAASACLLITACSSDDGAGVADATDVADAGADVPAETDVPEGDITDASGGVNLPDTPSEDADGDADEDPDIAVEVELPPPPPDPFTVPVFDAIRLSSLGSDEHFQSADASFDWGSGPFASVTMVVDLATTCFPFEGWLTNPPPAGQNYPADCDAFDRNFEFTLDRPTEEGDPPAIELVRAITPFGGPMHFEIDVTDIANGLPGEHAVRTHISTWPDGAGQISGSAGGWNVSMRFEVVPGPAPREVLAVIPLVDRSVGGGVATEPIPFQVPEGATHGRIDYRATGHGGATAPGCIGPAEEFCQRKHFFLLDGVAVDNATLWRDSCSYMCTLATHTWPNGQNFQYCSENPTGSIQSVNAPRANWCPGDLTPPHVVQDGALVTPGAHEFQFTIPGIIQGGSWRVSAVYIATAGSAPAPSR